MTVELFKVNKMTSLKIYISPVMEMLEMSNLDIGKSHLKGSIEYCTSGSSDVIT